MRCGKASNPLLLLASLPTVLPLAAGVTSQTYIAAACKRRRSGSTSFAFLSASSVSADDMAPSPPKVPFATAFEVQTPRGTCVAVHLPMDADECGASTSLFASGDLHEAELEVMARMLPHRRTTYAGGRIAMRRALRAAGASVSADEAVLTDDVGAPVINGGASGSISHTNGLAAAYVCVEAAESEQLAQARSMDGSSAARVVARDRTRHAVGVDVELASRRINPKVAGRVLTDRERQTLGTKAGLPSTADLLLRISIKEALYKALHPLLRQTIRWHSVQVHPQEGGACTVCIGELLDAVSIPLVAEAAWCVRDGYFVSTAAASVARHQPQALTRQPSSRSPRRGASG